MAREKPPAAPAGVVPAWFMTYSDTITLLMTFFILLLTFATNEPEEFQQMKTAAFGARGSAGVAGKNLDALDRENLVVRYRPDSARQTTRGSEAPLESGPVLEALGKGLKSLDEDDPLAESRRLEFDAPVRLLTDADGELTSYCLQRIRMISLQMRQNPFSLKLTVADEQDVPLAVKSASLVMSDPGIVPTRVAVSLQTRTDIPEGVMRFTILQELSSQGTR